MGCRIGMGDERSESEESESTVGIGKSSGLGDDDGKTGSGDDEGKSGKGDEDGNGGDEGGNGAEGSDGAVKRPERVLASFVNCRTEVSEGVGT
jgi:hypothetical protein